MDISFYGANCFKLATKDTNVVIDDNLDAIGLKHITTDSDVAVYTQDRLVEPDLGRLQLTSPGEYELADLTVIGVQAKAYTDKENEKSATIYRFISGTYQIVVLGHVDPKLDEKTLEAIGVVDVLIVPVGGSGLTLDAEDAAAVVKLLEPKVIIPSHFEDKDIRYEMPQHPLAEFLNKVGAAEHEPLKSLKIKGELPSGIVVLERQK